MKKYMIFLRCSLVPVMQVSSVKHIPCRIVGWVNVRLDLDGIYYNFREPKMYFAILEA
jgi:hypothetical protein